MIIFDLDGTLWDTSITTYEAANIVVKRNKEMQEITMDQVKRGMGLSEAEEIKNFMPYLDSKKADEYLKEINVQNMNIISEKGANLYDGVVETMKELSKKYQLGIITNNNNEYAETFLKCSNLKPYFIDYMGAMSYGITKSEAIKQMVERNNAKQSFYVGDIRKDMIASQEAGVIFIHAKYGFEPELDTEYHIERITELEKVLEEIG